MLELSQVNIDMSYVFFTFTKTLSNRDTSAQPTKDIAVYMVHNNDNSTTVAQPKSQLQYDSQIGLGDHVSSVHLYQ